MTHFNAKQTLYKVSCFMHGTLHMVVFKSMLKQPWKYWLKGGIMQWGNLDVERLLFFALMHENKKDIVRFGGYSYPKNDDF